MNTVDTRYLVILGTLPKCRHIGMSTLAYADEFSLCLKLYKCACLTYKPMYVVDNNEIYTHIFQV